MDRFARWARANQRPFADALEHAAEAGVTGKAARGAAELAALLAELRAMIASGASPGTLVATVTERTGYRGALEAEDTLDAQSRLENLAELEGAATEYDSLDEFLESVALVSDSDELDAGDRRVSLMTLHTAKGLEFPAVFLVGLEDGVFPHLRALEDPLQLEEERRLCYVGITRARRQLYLTHAWSRTLWGSTSHAIPSRFLSELPAELVRDVGSSWNARPDPLRTVSGVRRRPGTRWLSEHVGADHGADPGAADHGFDDGALHDGVHHDGVHHDGVHNDDMVQAPRTRPTVGPTTSTTPTPGARRAHPGPPRRPDGRRRRVPQRAGPARAGCPRWRSGARSRVAERARRERGVGRGLGRHHLRPHRRAYDALGSGGARPPGAVGRRDRPRRRVRERTRDRDAGAAPARRPRRRPRRR